MKQGLNVEVPREGVFVHRTGNHVIVEGTVTAGPKGSMGRTVWTYIPVQVVERLIKDQRNIQPVIDAEEVE